MFEKKWKKKRISHRNYKMTIIANVLYYVWRWNKKVMWYFVSQCAKNEEYYYGESMYQYVKVHKGGEWS